MLRGRRSACEVFDGLLGAVRDGRSGALVVRGEPGVGKTALLEYAIASASDLTAARAVGWSRRWSCPSQPGINCARRWSRTCRSTWRSRASPLPTRRIRTRGRGREHATFRTATRRITLDDRRAGSRPSGPTPKEPT